VIGRVEYSADRAAKALGNLLSTQSYAIRAKELSHVVNSERGTAAACDAIEDALRRPPQRIR
jgi:UDP:flavonoid glycosyltransferase YjiC (YdhE family)